jgi:hypothetical protein
VRFLEWVGKHPIISVFTLIWVIWFIEDLVGMLHRCN